MSGTVSSKSTDVEALGSEIPPVPEKCQHPVIRNIRYRLFQVYRRLFSVVFLGNLVIFIWFCTTHTAATLSSISVLSIPVAGNLFIASLFRTDQFINSLYYSVLWVPHALPLSIRRRLARIYEFGGVHSGAGVACAIWAVLFTAQLTRAGSHGGAVSPAAVGLTYMLVALLVAIIAAALPQFRAKQHNHFEYLHRFCGWTALGLFWALSVLLSTATASRNQQSFTYAFFTSPTSVLLIATTLLILLPWLRLRHVEAHATTLSKHATRIYFAHSRAGPARGIRISTSPLLEWHSFATIPCDDESGVAPASPYGFSVLIARAGDWTSSQIQNPDQARRYWIRGIPVIGVAHVVCMFQRAVVVTTGSGIGPALSLIAAARSTPCRLLWSTPSPLETYGAGVLEEVRRADADAVIWDTRKAGRPDMVTLTWRCFHEFGAEAVVCISNPTVTAQVVYGMESRGVPAYGPIFDS